MCKLFGCDCWTRFGLVKDDNYQGGCEVTQLHLPIIVKCQKCPTMSDTVDEDKVVNGNFIKFLKFFTFVNNGRSTLF